MVRQAHHERSKLRSKYSAFSTLVGIIIRVGAGYKPTQTATASQVRRTGAAIAERFWHWNAGGLETRPYRTT